MSVAPDHKQAVVHALLAYRQTYGGKVPTFVLEQFSDRTHVSVRHLRRWVADAVTPPTESTVCDTTAGTTTRVRHAKGRPFEFTEDHLVVMRSTLNAKAAHAILFPPENRTQAGWVSYPTFARAFKNLPPSIRDGILNGWDAMAKRQVYVSMAAPHRNHTWHLDHTEADLWVSLPGGRILRPYVSVVRDNTTSIILAATAYQGHPNEDSICDLLATAAMERQYAMGKKTVTVGGLPVQLVLDNGMEHFAEAVTRGALMLGVVINPTKAFYKHQNGTAESTFSGLNKQLLKGLPGYTKGGKGDNGKPLIAAKYPDQVDPATVLPIEVFQKHLDQWVVDKNTKGRLHRLGNRTPLAAWASDPTEIRKTPAETVRAMMQRASTGRVVNAEGIRFRGIDYIAPELGYYRERGLRLTVKFLMRETRFIDVFDGENWICRAYDRNLLTEGQRRAILLGRERDLDLLKRVNAEANQERLHRAMTEASAAYDGDETDPTVVDAVDDAVEKVTDITRARSKKKPKAKEAVGDLPAQESAPPAPNNSDDSEESELRRVDPTTPRRTKRQQAPSRSAAQAARAEKKNDEIRDRIADRPGANFGDDE